MQLQKQILFDVYGFHFPESFFHFYTFYKEIDIQIDKPLEDLLGIILGQIYDVFTDRFNEEGFNPIKTDRAYNDPPEFFTIMHGMTDGEHWGYYVEDFTKPENIFVATYFSNDAFDIQSAGATIFEAFRIQLENVYKDNQQNVLDDPEGKVYYMENIAALDKVRKILDEYALKERHEKGVAYLDKYKIERKCNVPTDDGIGILIDLQYYSPLLLNGKTFVFSNPPTKMEAEYLLSAALKAVEAGQPATALKAGKDLWIFRQYFDITYKILDTAYHALHRKELQKTLAIARVFRNEVEQKFL
jgi:hypothetical protein